MHTDKYPTGSSDIGQCHLTSAKLVRVSTSARVSLKHDGHQKWFHPRRVLQYFVTCTSTEAGVAPSRFRVKKRAESSAGGPRPSNRSGDCPCGQTQPTKIFVSSRNFGPISEPIPLLTRILLPIVESTSVCLQKITLATESVEKRGLVTEQARHSDIVKNSHAYWDAGRTEKNFAGTTLGYVTPVRTLDAEFDRVCSSQVHPQQCTCPTRVSPFFIRCAAFVWMLSSSVVKVFASTFVFSRELVFAGCRVRCLGVALLCCCAPHGRRSCIPSNVCNTLL